MARVHEVSSFDIVTALQKAERRRILAQQRAWQKAARREARWAAVVRWLRGVR